MDELELRLPGIHKTMFISEGIMDTVVGRILRWLPRFPTPVAHTMHSPRHSEYDKVYSCNYVIVYVTVDVDIGKLSRSV